MGLRRKTFPALYTPPPLMSVQSLFSENSYSLRCQGLAVDGTFTAGSFAASSVTVAGPAQVNGTLGVTGATTLGSSLAVTGATTATGALSCGSTLAVTGATTAAGVGCTTLTASGAVSCGSVSCSGTTTAGSLAVNGGASVSGVLRLPGTTVADYTQGNILAKNGSSDVVLKALTEVSTTPAWVWLNGSNPQPALVSIKAIRSGSYCTCQLAVSGLQLAAVGSPYTATFALPFAVTTAFSGGEILAATSFDPTSSVVITRCLVSAVVGSTSLAQLYIACSADTTIALGASFMYSGLAP